MRSPLLYLLLTAPLALAGKGNGHGNGSPCGKPPPIVTPNTVVLDGARMAQTKEAIRNLNPNGKRSSVHCRKTKPPSQSTCDLSTELDNLLLQADDWMSKGPWTVVSKTMSVPNGTAKDYASQAPYWWAANWDNPSSTEKCPYIQRDGIRNPEVDNYSDRRDGAAMMTSVYTLALAWWYTDNVAYRVHCADILRTWFINNGTRMTPNLRHAQIVPCQNDGRAIGIIDFSQQYTAVLDAAVLMATVEDASWGSNETQWFKDWNREFLTWLDESDFGKVELAAKNNHGTFAAMQIAGLAMYLGQDDLARKRLQEQLPRIDTYIAANGSQPLEIKRPTSFHYTTFTLVAYTRMVAMGKKLGIDMWGYVGAQGQSIKKAIEYLIPAATGEAEWPHPELHFQRFAAFDVVNFAADEGLEMAKAAVAKLEQPPGGGLWCLRPAVEQLDSILLQ